MLHPFNIVQIFQLIGTKKDKKKCETGILSFFPTFNTSNKTTKIYSINTQNNDTQTIAAVFFWNTGKPFSAAKVFFLGARLAGQVGTACCGSTKVRSTLGPGTHLARDWSSGFRTYLYIACVVCIYKYTNIYVYINININIFIYIYYKCKIIYIHIIYVWGLNSWITFEPETNIFPSNLADLCLSSCQANQTILCNGKCY